VFAGVFVSVFDARHYFIFLAILGLSACAHRPQESTDMSSAPSAEVSTNTPEDTAAKTTEQATDQRYLGKDKDWGPSDDIDMSQVPDAVPRYELRTIAGNKNPYTILGKTYVLLDDERSYKKRGVASWYGYKFNGERTSNGELYDMFSMTAAHKTLPIPSYVRVTNLENNTSVVVRVNDRGPFHDNRIIDLSYAAAQRLGITQRGTGKVEVEILVPEDDPRPPLSKRKLLAKNSKVTPAIKAPQNTLYLSRAGYLQIAAFGVESSAQQYTKNIVEQLAYPVVISSTHDQPILYRVRVGPFKDAQSLEDARNQLQKMNILQSYVVYD
jgi:rare lipoprotein A